MKKIVINTFMVIFFIAVGFGVCYCYQNMDINNANEETIILGEKTLG